MTKREAIVKAEEYLANEVQKRYEPLLGVVEELIKEKKGFYVVPFNSVDHIKSGDILDSITDNHPLIVRASDGKVFETSFKYELEDYIEYFEYYGELKTEGPAWWEPMCDDFYELKKEAIIETVKKARKIDTVGGIALTVIVIMVKYFVSLKALSETAAIIIAVTAGLSYVALLVYTHRYVKGLRVITTVSKSGLTLRTLKKKWDIESFYIDKVVYDKVKDRFDIFTEKKSYSLPMGIYKNRESIIYLIKDSLCRKNEITLEVVE